MKISGCLRPTRFLFFRTNSPRAQYSGPARHPVTLRTPFDSFSTCTPSSNTPRTATRNSPPYRASPPKSPTRLDANLSTVPWRRTTPAPVKMAAAVEQLVQKVQDLSLEKYPDAQPQVDPLDVYRAHLSNILGEISGALPEIVFGTVHRTATIDKGDFTVATPAFRLKGTKPEQTAANIVEKFPENDVLFEKPVASGYFLTFTLKAQPLVQAVIPMIRDQGSQFGFNKRDGLRDPKAPEQGKKRIIVEFSSPNVAKPFHAGHLRSTIIGSFLANMYEAAGWDVRRINYLGDWGKQYGLLALAYEKFGNEEALKKDPIDHLFQLYVRINAEKEAEKEKMEEQKKEGKDISELEGNSLDEQARQYFKKMTDGDEAALDTWRRFRDLSIARYKETYARLNIHFNEYSGESQVLEKDMARFGKDMAEKKISREENGASIVDFPKLIAGKEGKRLAVAVVRKRDGTALYLTRDISELMARYDKYQYDRMLYVVASAQELHLKQLFKIVELLGHKDIADRCQHISFGLVLGMSTRKGTVKFLNDILKDCADHMHEVMKKNEDKYAQVADPVGTADILGISSVMIQDMMGKRINNYTFNMDAMTSFEGDTGPYLQYAHARLCSIRRRVDLSDEEISSADLSLLTEQHAINIVRMLSRWPSVFQDALKTQEPTTILTYLFRLTHVISSSYDHLQVVGSEPELLKARMALYDASKTVLSSAMQLLGLTPLQRM